MTQQVLREEKPPCFGRVDEPDRGQEGWNPQCPSCFGGADPSYVNERGSHVRDRCVFFSSCGSVVQAKKMETARSIIDPASLLRPSPPPAEPARPTMAGQPPSFMGQFGSALIRQQEAARQIALQQQQQGVAHPQHQAWSPQQQPAGMYSNGYQQLMPVNHYMPSYLSAPEPVTPGSFLRMMAVTVFRSMGKSAGHSVAHLFDTVPLGTGKPPGG